MNVDVLEPGISPISLVAVVQTSNMSLAAIAKIKKIGSMISLAVVGANGTAALVTYDAQVKLVQDFTTDAGAISDAFAHLKAADAITGHFKAAARLAFPSRLELNRPEGSLNAALLANVTDNVVVRLSRADDAAVGTDGRPASTSLFDDLRSASWMVSRTFASVFPSQSPSSLTSSSINAEADSTETGLFRSRT